MSAISFPRIERTEIDGVATVWSPGPGLRTGTLHFRVGRVDEHPARAGVTHVVEHLAMVPLGQPRYEHNAFVEPIRTTFFASGRDDDLVSFFGGVTTALGALPVDRLDLERVVLRRESEGRSKSVVDAHRHFRFGLTAHGLPAQDEFGLGAVSGDEVLAWSRSRFVSADAAAWVTGEPPAGLRFTLPTGSPSPLPHPTSFPDIRWPAHVEPGLPGVAIGFVLQRTRGAGSFVEILQRRLRKQLRIDRGLVYDILADYEPLDESSGLGLVGADCAADQNQQVADIVLEQIESLGRGETTPDELADEVADMERALGDETSIGGLLDLIVRDRLTGMPERSPEQRYDEQRTTTAEDIALHARAALASGLLIADVDEHPGGIAPYPTGSIHAVTGREVRPLLSAFGFGPKVRLLIGDDGVTVRTKEGQLTTVRYEECAVLEHPKDDELVMWGLDGTRLYVPGAFWRGGEGVIEEIVRAVPPDIVITDMFSSDYFD